MEFMTSDEQMLRKALVTGSYWPTTFEPTAAQAKQLEPLSYDLLQQAESVAATYPHAKFATPQAFTDAWINHGPPTCRESSPPRTSSARSGRGAAQRRRAGGRR